MTSSQTWLLRSVLGQGLTSQPKEPEFSLRDKWDLSVGAVVVHMASIDTAMQLWGLIWKRTVAWKSSRGQTWHKLCAAARSGIGIIRSYGD